MRTGIIGLPGCGKTTVFRALTGLPSGAASGPRGHAVRGVVKVPDERLQDLARRHSPRKVTSAEVVLADLPGPGPGEGGPQRSLTQAALQEMQGVDMLLHVVREFDSPATGPADPLADLASLSDEMILRDLEGAEKRLARLKKGEQPSFPAERDTLESICDALGSSRTIRSMGLGEDVMVHFSGFAFLTEKPQIVVLSRDDAAASTPLPGALVQEAEKEARAVIGLCARLETELAEIDPGERGPFMAEMGIETAGTDMFIREVYGALGLVSFFTTAGDEVRAWTVRSGTTALRAAGKIHTDMERGFIRAEVYSHDDLVAMGSEAALRKAGRIRQEGKEYVVRDGDILNVKFNV